MPVTIGRFALTAADFLAQRFGLLDRPFSSEALMEAACRRTGLADFGPTPIAEPLRRFLDACCREASLGVLGRIATRWDVLRFLTNLLRLAAAERQNAGILREAIERPIIITGLPRSGTTFLHRLMLCDPANRGPLVWETIYPYRDARDRGTVDRRPAQVERQLRSFVRLAPELPALHPLRADSPQECSEITAHAFRSLRFDTTYRIPSYRTWLETDAQGHVPAYRLHKRFLQHLQHQEGGGPNPRRWVLKCPDHLFALTAIRAVYPDACLVFVHRDPLKVLLSVAKLTEVLRRPFSRHVDPMEIGRQESARWVDGAGRMMEASEPMQGASPVCHVNYLDLVSDPSGTVASVYRHFAMPFSQQAAAAVARRAAELPSGGYPPHRYRFEEHGLDAEAEREKFRPYMLHFDIAPETEAGRQAALRNVRLMRQAPVAGCSPSANGSIP